MSQKERVRTITDLARLAGVSAGTVSRALADSPLIASATRARIQALAAEHDFRPNILARNLRTRRTGVVGVVMEEAGPHSSGLASLSLAALLCPLAAALATHGYDTLLMHARTDSSDWLRDASQSGRVDGLLLIGTGDAAMTEDRAARYHPLVAWGTPPAGGRLCAIGTDEAAAARMLVGHFAARGARHLLLVEDLRGPAGAERIAALGKAAAAASLRTTLAALDAGGTLNVGDGIDGAIATGLWAGMAVLQQPRVAAGRLPVAAWEDAPVGALASPPLTVARFDLTAGAAAMADLLVRRIAGEDTSSILLAPELVVRASA